MLKDYKYLAARPIGGREPLAGWRGVLMAVALFVIALSLEATI